MPQEKTPQRGTSAETAKREGSEQLYERKASPRRDVLAPLVTPFGGFDCILEHLRLSF